MHDPSLAQVQSQCQKLFKFWVQPCSPWRRILLTVKVPAWVQLISPLIFRGRIKQTYPLYYWLLPALSSIYCGLLCSSTTRLHHNVSTQSWVREDRKKIINGLTSPSSEKNTQILCSVCLVSIQSLLFLSAYHFITLSNAWIKNFLDWIVTITEVECITYWWLQYTTLITIGKFISV